MLNLLNKLICN